MQAVCDILTAPSVTTHEIAELTGKRVNSVNRDIVVMLDKLSAAGIDISGAVIERDARNYIKSATLDRTLALTLITGYGHGLRHGVVLSWIERLDRLTAWTPGQMGSTSAPRRQVTPAEYDEICAQCDLTDEDYPTNLEIVDQEYFK